MKYRKSLLIKLLILVEVLLIVFAAQYLIGKYGKTSISDDNDTVSKADNVSEEIEVSSEEPVSTLFFASDYQSENGWDDPQYTLSCILDKAIADGKNIDGVIMCGDYSNEYKKYDYQTSPEYAISTIQAIVLEKCHELKPDNIIFEQGNHDALTESISETGLHEYPDYLVYVLNTQYDFPWSQGKSAGCLAKVRKSA